MKELEVKGARLWIGRILFWLSAAFMIVDVGMHVARPPFVLEASAKAGIDAALLLPIGIYELVAVVFLLVPRFRALGALMYTAFLGGATASHLLVSHTPFVFPVITAVLLWVGVVCLSPKTGSALGLEEGPR
jgi:DoxX-like family